MNKKDIAATRQGTSIALYIDGEVVQSWELVAPLTFDDTHGLLIGTREKNQENIYNNKKKYSFHLWLTDYMIEKVKGYKGNVIEE